MRPIILILLTLTACSTPAPMPASPPRSSLCACRAICAPDGYEWELTYSYWDPDAGSIEAGRCKCVGGAR